MADRKHWTPELIAKVAAAAATIAAAVAEALQRVH
jgi:hypothetical protein